LDFDEFLAARIAHEDHFFGGYIDHRVVEYDGVKKYHFVEASTEPERETQEQRDDDVAHGYSDI